MPIQAEIEGLGSVEFPDGSTPEEITKAVNTHFALPQPADSSPYGGRGSEAPVAREQTYKETTDATPVAETGVNPMKSVLSKSALDFLSRNSLPGLAGRFLDRVSPGSTAGKISKGIAEGTGDVEDFMTSPAGVASLGIGGLPAAAQRIATGGIAGYMAAQLPEQYRTLKKAVGEGDTEQAVRIATGMAVQGAGVVGGLAHAAGILPKATAAAAEALKERPAAEVPADAVQTPSEAATKEAEPATKPPEAAINVREAVLEPHQSDLLQSEAKAGGHKVEVVSGQIDTGDPLGRQIASIDRKSGKIRINPQELSAWLNNNVPKGQEQRAIRSLLGEERIHLATPDDSALEYHDSATAAERAIAQRVYGGPKGETLSPTLLGHEMLRIRMQQLARMDVRETLERSLKERWTVKSMLAASDAIRSVREALGTTSAREAGAITDRIQDNLEAAIKARTGEAPGATAKGEETDYDKYQAVTSRLKGLLDEVKSAPPDKKMELYGKFTEVQKELEAIKNRHKGMPPAKPVEEIPGARRKAGEEKTPEFFLPPIKTGETRATATEAGALPEQKPPPQAGLETYQTRWSKPNAWTRLPDAPLEKPVTLGNLLTEGSRSSGSDPVSKTRRLVALEKDGKVDVVSIYRDAEDGARAVDPAYAGKLARPNRSLKSLLDEGYKPIASMLREEPVQNFHRRFDSVEQFEQTVGQPHDQQAAKVGGYESPPAVTQATAPTAVGEGTGEDRAVHQLFSKAEHPESAFQAIQNAPNKRQVLAYMKRAIGEAMKANPELSALEAAKQVTGEIYEQTKSQSEDDFVRRIGEQAAQDAEHPAEQTVNDLGQSQSAAEESGPGAIRKFAQEQLKLTDDDIKDYVTSRGVRDNIARAYDAAGNVPNVMAAREENGVRLQSSQRPTYTRERLSTQWTKGKKDVLAAANAVVQAQAVRKNGTIDNARRGQLPIFRQQVQRGAQEATRWLQSRNLRQRRMGAAWLRSQNELLKELDYAEQHWNDPDLQRTAARMHQSLREQWTRERAAGFEVSKDLNYVPQRYDAAVWNQHSMLFNAIEGAEKILGGKFRKPRSFETYYAASEAGPYIPVTRDGASLVGHRVRQGMNLISRDAWSEGLKSATTPGGEPVAIPAKMSSTGQLLPPASRSYSNMLVSGKALAIHDDFIGLIDNLTSPSKVENWPVTRTALRAEQMLKHGLLLGDFFHLGRMLYYARSIMGKNAGWKGGWSVLDLKPQDIQQAVSKGIISQEDADWGSQRIPYGNSRITRRQLAERFIGSGANLGKIQDALYKDLITDMTPAASPLRRGVQRVIDPSVGRYNRFLFDKLTRGLMTEANVREFERQHAAYPKLDPDKLVKDISRDVNNYFGNIGKQGWVKSATQKDLSRLLFLAPDWVEGLIKKEASFYGRAIGSSKVAGTREGVTNLGTTGRGIGRGLVFLLGLTQAINLITRKQPTWMNKEKGHKFDAYIPAFGGKGEGFWLSPLSVFNEITHDLWRYMESDRTAMQAIDQVAGNKESPLTRAAIMTLVGSGQGGIKPTTSMGQLGQAAKDLAPMPLTFGRLAQIAGHAVAPGVVSPPPRGSVQRQGFSALGLKIEPKLSAAQEIGKRATEFARANGFKKDTGWEQVQTDEPSYSKLRSALRNGDDKEAQRQYYVLRKGRTDKQIFHAMKLSSKRPFTGSKQAESAFIRSLDDAELKSYYDALDQRQREYGAFEDFVLSQSSQ